MNVKATFGIFATLASPVGEASVLRQLSASFRVLSMCNFHNRVLLISILRAEGFYNFELLAKLANQYLERLKALIKEEDMMSIRDLRLVAKLASLIREQERRVYYEQLLNLRESQMSESQKNMFTKLR